MPPQQPSNETASKSYIYIYEIVQLEPPNINVFLILLIYIYEKYLVTEGVCLQKNSLYSKTKTRLYK